MTALLFCAFATVLRADPQPEVDYQAPRGCPPSEAFSGEVRARLEGIGGAEIENPRIRVTIARVGGKLHGRLLVEHLGEAPLERTVEARRCTDLVSALALIVALSLQERAVSTQVPSAPEGATAPTPREPPSALAVSEPVADSRWSLAIGAGVDTALGMAPDVLLAIPIFIEARFRGARLHPELRLAFVQTLTDRAQAGPATADFSVLFGEIDLCPTVFRLGQRIQIAPCAGMQAGALSAGGVGLSAPRSETRPWVAPLALLRGSATIRRRFFAQLEIGVGFPLTRDRFLVDPGILVWEIPPTTMVGGAAVGFAFL